MKPTATKSASSKSGKGGIELTQREAQHRLAQFGYNELAEKKRDPLLEMLAHFWGPIPGLGGQLYTLDGNSRQNLAGFSQT